MFLVPRADYRIDDDWHTVGMCGTGSASVVTDNVFVPAHRVVSMRDIHTGKAPGARFNTAPLYRMPLLGFAQLALAAVPIGVAVGMVNDFRAFLSGRGGVMGSGGELLQERFAEAAAAARAATLLLMDTALRNTAILAAGEMLGEADSLRSQHDGGYAVMMVRRAATRLVEATGGRGLQLTQPLQRGFRDILGAAAHGSLGWDRSALRYAQFMLGAKG